MTETTRLWTLIFTLHSGGSLPDGADLQLSKLTEDLKQSLNIAGMDIQKRNFIVELMDGLPKDSLVFHSEFIGFAGDHYDDTFVPSTVAKHFTEILHKSIPAATVATAVYARPIERVKERI